MNDLDSSLGTSKPPITSTGDKIMKPFNQETKTTLKDKAENITDAENHVIIR